MNDEIAVPKLTASSSRRSETASGTMPIGSARSAAVVSGDDSTSPAARLRVKTSTTSATTRLVIAATSNVPGSPTSPTSTNPDTSTPHAAPRLFAK